MIAPAIRLAIFDADGTLVDSFPWFCSVVNEVARRHGFREAREDEVDKLRGMRTREIMRELSIPVWKVPSIARDLRALKLDAAAELRPFPGTHDLLATLHARGVKLAIVSSDSERSIRRTLGPETSGLISMFRCDASLFGKAGRLKATLRDAVVPAAEAIYVGDETRDAVAAKKAGLRFGASTWGYASEAALRASDPDLVFSRLEDVADLLS
ncbi:HAD hydrolase-like protein [Terrihabitans rhizophilus]|jgi:phosphoglycolate phosphatase|uniref:HAD hydrolase-like protein n=1 Tax=Terrihabitans rhizophilus TaxID=3092662 RepID=A0ABU4RPK7_9HYPH|nr:HAD hydrolase-like protein [Terrihabitans sp. PJ23]MDX6806759.1 HAD hydrolase-like protein [Terrihabitans sp. PJ23]